MESNENKTVMSLLNQGWNDDDLKRIGQLNVSRSTHFLPQGGSLWSYVLQIKSTVDLSGQLEQAKQELSDPAVSDNILFPPNFTSVFKGQMHDCFVYVQVLASLDLDQHSWQKINNFALFAENLFSDKTLNSRHLTLFNLGNDELIQKPVVVVVQQNINDNILED